MNERIDLVLSAGLHAGVRTVLNDESKEERSCEDSHPLGQRILSNPSKGLRGSSNPSEVEKGIYVWKKEMNPDCWWIL